MASKGPIFQKSLCRPCFSLQNPEGKPTHKGFINKPVVEPAKTETPKQTQQTEPKKTTSPAPTETAPAETEQTAAQQATQPTQQTPVQPASEEKAVAEEATPPTGDSIIRPDCLPDGVEFRKDGLTDEERQRQREASSAILRGEAKLQYNEEGGYYYYKY